MNQENKTTKKKNTTKKEETKKTVTKKPASKIKKTTSTKKPIKLENKNTVSEKEIVATENVSQKKLKSKNTFRTSEVVFLVISACVLSFVMATLIFKKDGVEFIRSDNKVPDEFIKQYENIIDNYYGDIDKDKLIDGAIKGMVQSLNDPYATYFDTSEAKNFNIQLDGEFEGIGVEILKNSDKTITILNIFDDSPASKAGLNIGDKILSADGLDALNMTTEEIANMISKNKKVKLLVERSGKKLEVDLKVDKVNIKSVTSKIIEKSENKIGYIKINIFALNTYDQFKEQLNNLEKNNIDSLIIDLRDNSGGHLTSVENILSSLISKSKIIYRIKKPNKIEKVYSKGKKDKNYPIAVLVNNESASGSEIVAAALKEDLGAIIIGQNTYGKGTAQELITLSSGEQYKFTTKEWLTPNGNSINSSGIKPDIVVADDLCIDKAVENLVK